MTATVAQALDAFRRAHGFAADEASHASWTCRLGPLTLRLPNFAWRRRAILAHDLHHVLTGIPCTLRGECQMAAWELGAGPMPHWGARLFCQPLILFGLLWTPRSVWRAFLAGRRSRSLHDSVAIPSVLARPLHAVREEFAGTSPKRATMADHARFAVLSLQATAIIVAPAGLLAIAAVLAAG